MQNVLCDGLGKGTEYSLHSLKTITFTECPHLLVTK